MSAHFEGDARNGVDLWMVIGLDYGNFGVLPRKSYLNDIVPAYGRRRGGRVSIRVPVELRGTSGDGSPVEQSVDTAVVSELGALVRASSALRIGTEVVLTNRFTQQTARFRVVYVGEQRLDGLWETGIESLVPLDDFWGVRFPAGLDPRV